MPDKRDSLLYCINVYRSLPALWNTNDPRYTNRQAKNRAYDTLLASYKTYDPDANRETLVKKINSLRTNFRKELKKVENSKKSSELASGIYVPTLWYYKELMFLVDQETPEELHVSRPSLNGDVASTIDKKDEDILIVDQEAQSQYSSYAQATVAQTHNSPTEAEVHIRTPGTEGEALTHIPSKRRKPQNTCKSVDFIYKLAARHLNKEDDEFLILAKSYAQKLKNMLPLQRLFADRLIHEVLLEGQLENLSRHCSIDLNSAIAPVTVQTHLCRSDLLRPSSTLSSLFSEGTTTYSEHPKCGQSKPPDVTPQPLSSKDIENPKSSTTGQ